VHHKLAQAGIHQTFQPVTHQREVRPLSGDGVLIDGQIYSSLLPEDLRDLPAPPRGASEADKLAYEAKFNLWARWRMARHAAPDRDGATRWRCPFCAGFLRSRDFPTTMRRPATVPLVAPTGERDRCCGGIQTALPVETALWQRIPYGTTAWRISMGRRQVVESVNAALKGAFADPSRGFVRVMGVTKITVMPRLTSPPTTSTASAPTVSNTTSTRTARPSDVQADSSPAPPRNLGRTDPHPTFRATNRLAKQSREVAEPPLGRFSAPGASLVDAITQNRRPEGRRKRWTWGGGGLILSPRHLQQGIS
jgi:hypothetical protein